MAGRAENRMKRERRFGCRGTWAMGGVCRLWVGGWEGGKEGRKGDGYGESVVGCGGRVVEEVFGLRRWGRAVVGCDSGGGLGRFIKGVRW